MDDISNRIIDYLRKNRVSTTEVADVLGKKGALENVNAINRGLYRAGKVKWLYAYDESNWPVHEQLQQLEENNIVFVEAFDCNNRAIFGELVSKYILLYKQSQAIVVNGKLRDAPALIKENWPIWCTGFTPVGCFNRRPTYDFDKNTVLKHYELYNDSVAVCDDCGVVIIQKNNLNQDFLNGLIRIENQEDIWFDRLDHYKENTFQIVCEKNYLSDTIYMSRKQEQ